MDTLSEYKELARVHKKRGKVVADFFYSTLQVKVKSYKLDWERLRKDVEKYPDASLVARAKKFVTITTVWGALNQMGRGCKKNFTYQEQEETKKQKYIEHIATYASLT